MVMRVGLFAALVLALMVAVKDGRFLKTTGLTAVCVVAQTAADGTQLEACRPGKLQGVPDLSGNGCKDAGKAGSYEYWRCPAGVESGPNGN